MASGFELPQSFREALALARRILAANHELVRNGVIDTEAEILVSEAFRRAAGVRLSRADLHLRSQDRYPEAAASQLLLWAGARAQGRPLQHLTGVQEFLDHEYEVGPEVLVPRPETEFLVSVASDELRGLSSAPALGLEVGLGSGAISIELLSRFTSLRMIASELMAPAAACATRNAAKILGPSWQDRLQIVEPGSPLQVLEPFHHAFQGGSAADFLISNPPYMTRDDFIGPDVLAHEPETALFAPEADPLHFYRCMAEGGREVLRPGGRAFLELPHERAGEILKVFKNSGWDARILQDLAGRDRILLAKGT